MALELIKENSGNFFKKGKFCIKCYHQDNYAEFYLPENIGIKIPFNKINYFMNYLSKKYNGNGSINFSINRQKIKIPFSKLEEISKYLREVESIGKKGCVIQRVF